MSKSSWFHHALAALVFGALFAYWFTADFFGHELLAKIAVFAVLAMSLDLLAGYNGQVSLAHGAMFGLGAYAFAILAGQMGWSVPLAMLAASLIVGAVALVIGAVVTRTHGIFFIMITLAIGEMGHEFFFQNRATGGDDGLFGIPRLDLSWAGVDLLDPATLSLSLLLVAVIVYVKLAWLMVSPYGAVLVGIHENERRMRALGLPVRAYKTSAFALSGAIAGFAGTLTAQHTQFITPELLHWTTSGEVLMMVILGGLATLVGPIIGAIIVVMMRNQLSSLTDYWGFWLGVLLIAIVMARRNGVVGWLDLGWAWVLSLVRKAPGAPPREVGDAAR